MIYCNMKDPVLSIQPYGPLSHKFERRSHWLITSGQKVCDSQVVRPSLMDGRVGSIKRYSIHLYVIKCIVLYSAVSTSLYNIH